jgi:hypothetical protein
MSKQTALEWLVEQLKEYSTENLIEIDWDEFNQLFQQAKEMEKLQHGYTWDSALEYHEKRGYKLMRTIDDFDEYWENKLGGEND